MTTPGPPSCARPGPAVLRAGPAFLDARSPRTAALKRPAHVLAAEMQPPSQGRPCARLLEAIQLIAQRLCQLASLSTRSSSQARSGPWRRASLRARNGLARRRSRGDLQGRARAGRWEPLKTMSAAIRLRICCRLCARIPHRVGCRAQDRLLDAAHCRSAVLPACCRRSRTWDTQPDLTLPALDRLR